MFFPYMIGHLKNTLSYATVTGRGNSDRYLISSYQAESRPDFEHKGILKASKRSGKYRSEIKRIDERQLYADKIGKEVFKTEEKRKRECTDFKNILMCRLHSKIFVSNRFFD